MAKLFFPIDNLRGGNGQCFEPLILDMGGDPEGHFIEKDIYPLIMEEVQRSWPIFDILEDHFEMALDLLSGMAGRLIRMMEEDRQMSPQGESPAEGEASSRGPESS